MIRLCKSAVELAARRGSEVVAATSDSNAREELAAGGLLAMGAELAAGASAWSKERSACWGGSQGHAPGGGQGAPAMERLLATCREGAPWGRSSLLKNLGAMEQGAEEATTKGREGGAMGSSK